MVYAVNAMGRFIEVGGYGVDRRGRDGDALIVVKEVVAAVADLGVLGGGLDVFCGCEVGAFVVKIFCCGFYFC